MNKWSLPAAIPGLVIAMPAMNAPAESLMRSCCFITHCLLVDWRQRLRTESVSRNVDPHDLPTRVAIDLLGYVALRLTRPWSVVTARIEWPLTEEVVQCTLLGRPKRGKRMNKLPGFVAEASLEPGIS